MVGGARRAVSGTEPGRAACAAGADGGARWSRGRAEAVTWSFTEPALAERFGGEFDEWIGEDLVAQNFPAIHAVGRAAARALGRGEATSPLDTETGRAGQQASDEPGGGRTPITTGRIFLSIV